MKHSARKHARLAPSAAARWLACPGSIRLSEGIVDKGSVFAAEGTTAHELAERCLRTGADPSFDSMSPDMSDAVQVYLDECRAYMCGDIETEIEVRLNLDHIEGMDGGTGDFVAYDTDRQRLTLIDYKHGKGVVVDPKENAQLLTYAIGAVRRFHNRGVNEVELIVVQPRATGEAVKRWVTTPIDLIEFQIRLADGAKATMAPDAPLVPGDHCKFCPAAPICPALSKLSEEAAQDEFSPQFAYDSAALAKAFGKLSAVKAWCASVESFAHSEATEGRIIPGYKLVDGKSFRKWREPGRAYQQLILEGLKEDEIMTEPELKSPAQIEPLMPGKNKVARALTLAGLIDKKASGTVLAPLSDPRPSAGSDAEQEFGPV